MSLNEMARPCCSACGARLIAIGLVAPNVQTTLFSDKNVEVNRLAIVGPKGAIPLEHVLSVRTRRISFSTEINVELLDLSRKGKNFRFRDRKSANEFIAAIQKAKGSVNVEDAEIYRPDNLVSH